MPRFCSQRAISTAAAIYNYTTVIKSTCWNKIYALMLPLDGLLGSFGLLELLDQESGTGTEAINSGREDQEVVTKMDDFVTCYTAFQHLLCCLTLWNHLKHPRKIPNSMESCLYNTVSGSIRDVWSEADASLYEKVTLGVLSKVELNLN